MFALRSVSRSSVFNASWRSQRFYATQIKPTDAQHVKEEVQKPKEVDGATVALSSCTENTVLEGLQWLKNQKTVLALADDQYPPWLWTLLEPKVLPDDGPGGKAEKYRLRKDNRQRIRDQNFMKTQ